jgi:hypothetical protein
MVAYCARDGDATWLGNPLQSGRDVDAVTENVVALHNDVAHVHTHAKLDAPFRRHVRIADSHAALQLGGAGDRVHNASEFHQHPVAGELYSAALMLGDFAVDQFLAMGVQRGERASFIPAHETAVTDHIGGQNSGQTAFHAPALHDLARRTLSRLHGRR